MKEKSRSGKIPRHGLERIYRRLYSYFGPQGWWPAQTRCEVIVGAILTQNTSWRNVERAVSSMRRQGLLRLKALDAVAVDRLARVIRSAGYYNSKARSLKAFLALIKNAYHRSLHAMAREEPRKLRRNLLSVKGIGPETADSILLYAFGVPVFVVDSYTRRILARHGLIPEDASYDMIQKFFMDNLKPDAVLYNEYHALLVRLGKEVCLKNNPRCAQCPLRVKS